MLNEMIAALKAKIEKKIPILINVKAFVLFLLKKTRYD
tara:strand:- start:31 stop:144 length:114 start_codon:yes stop_codon:yes gene_type:complete